MKTIEKMAREVGGVGINDYYTNGRVIAFSSEQLEALVELVRAEAQAEEREAILELVDSYAKNNTDLAAAIRARGNT